MPKPNTFVFKLVKFGGFEARIFDDGSTSFTIRDLFGDDSKTIALESGQVGELIDELSIYRSYDR